MRTVPAVVVKGSTLTTRSEVIKLTDRIRENLDQAARTFWDIGNDLGRIKREHLYRLLSYDTFHAYVAGELKVKLRQAQKMLALAQAFVRDDAVAVGGVERGTALMRYCKLLPGRPDPGELVRADALVGELPLSACSVDDIAAATQAQRAQNAKARGRSPAERRAASTARAVAKAVRAFARDSELGRPDVVVRDDEVVVRFVRSTVERRFLAR